CTPATSTLSLHDALPICLVAAARPDGSTELGLAPAPTFHDLLVLDPSLRASDVGPGFPRSSRIGVAELPGAGLAPEVVIICENRSEEHTSELQSRFDLVC